MILICHLACIVKYKWMVMMLIVRPISEVQLGRSNKDCNFTFNRCGSMEPPPLTGSNLPLTILSNNFPSSMENFLWFHSWISSSITSSSLIQRMKCIRGWRITFSPRTSWRSTGILSEIPRPKPSWPRRTRNILRITVPMVTRNFKHFKIKIHHFEELLQYNLLAN